jgi:hypothetical protein
MDPLNRRHFIRSLAAGSALLPGMLSELMAQTASNNPLAPKAGHFPAKAKHVIFLYMSGGTSHVDTFDYKPKLIADNGKKYRPTTNRDAISKNVSADYLSGPRWKFEPNPRCGTMVSDLFPHIRSVMHEICLIRSMKTDIANHTEGVMALHGGSVRFPRPSFGSWVTYGLGTENQNLPAFIVLAPEMPYAGNLVWDSQFLPAAYLGVRVIPGKEPIPNIESPDLPEIQELKLGMMDFLNKRHLVGHGNDNVLAGRIKTFETAFGMQTEAPEAFDVSKESDATLKLYGLERGSTEGFAWQCLVARRLAERGVRFIELIDTGTLQLVNWDAHADMKTHIPLARNVDQPIAALIKDLKGRGMFDETLVVWTSEMGRRPGDVQPEMAGRGHWGAAFSSWLAGGGIKGGITYGETDDYGYNIVKDQCHVHDFQATILNQMGLDHTKLTYRHDGRDYRLTDLGGRVIKEILS